jgi:hypothetical protein
VQAEHQHRGHAVIEQVFAELIDGPLAHLPSGNFNANNAWLAGVAIAHNLTGQPPASPDWPSPPPERRAFSLVDAAVAAPLTVGVHDPRTGRVG